jgi:hypothetical protein
MIDFIYKRTGTYQPHVRGKRLRNKEWYDAS